MFQCPSRGRTSSCPSKVCDAGVRIGSVAPKPGNSEAPLRLTDISWIKPITTECTQPSRHSVCQGPGEAGSTGIKPASITRTDEMQNPSRKLLSSGSQDCSLPGCFLQKPSWHLEPGVSKGGDQIAEGGKGEIPAAAAPSIPAGKVGGGECPEKRSR